MASRSATAPRTARCRSANSASPSAGTAVRQAAPLSLKPAGNGAHVKQPHSSEKGRRSRQSRDVSRGQLPQDDSEIPCPHEGQLQVFVLSRASRGEKLAWAEPWPKPMHCTWRVRQQQWLCEPPTPQLQHGQLLLLPETQPVQSHAEVAWMGNCYWLDICARRCWEGLTPHTPGD